MQQPIWKNHIAISIASALLMVIAYFLPLWKITLVAPQYPEGLAMYIMSDEIQGGTENDLQNINILNHYIGMKEINPDEIPELKFIPWIMGALAIFALLPGILRMRTLYLVYIGLLVVAGIVGLVDFWLWEYDYGHNLDPNAPIIIEGMSYQPPLIACKQMLNINACSWPWIGSLLIGLSGLVAGYGFLQKGGQQ